MDGRDRRSRQFGGNVGGDHRQAKNLDMECLAGRPDPLQLRPREVAQTQLEVAPRNRLLHRVGLPIELSANRRPNEVGAIGIESLSNEQVDVAEIDISEIYGDLLAVPPADRSFLPETIPLPSTWMVNCLRWGEFNTYRTRSPRNCSKWGGAGRNEMEGRAERAPRVAKASCLPSSLRDGVRPAPLDIAPEVAANAPLEPK